MKNNSRQYLEPLLMAIALLTRIPVTQYLPQEWRDKALGISALWYPLVGVIISLLLMVFVRVLPAEISPWVAAMVVTTLWVVITGALHLDGLADCVDAMYAGHSVMPSTTTETAAVTENPQRDKILRVLKEPTVGCMGVIALVIVLLAKVILVASLWPSVGFSVLMAIVLSRMVAALFMAFTPYSSHTHTAGLGQVMARHIPKNIMLVIAALIIGVVFFLVTFFTFIILFVSIVGCVWLWRKYWMKHLDGFVGDVVGALIEMIEVWVLFIMYCAVL
jgi:adenosylcobinamide-GDP ribazoletransferase